MFVFIFPGRAGQCIYLLHPVSEETVYDESVQGIIFSVLTEIQFSAMLEPSDTTAVSPH